MTKNDHVVIITHVNSLRLNRTDSKVRIMKGWKRGKEGKKAEN